MSYAAAASKNRLPPDQQPHPDQSLLEGDHHVPGSEDLSHSTATDEKVHVVSREEFEEDSHPVDEYSRPEPVRLTSSDAAPPLPSARETEAKSQANVEKVESKAKETGKEVKKEANKDIEAGKKEVKKDTEEVKKEVKKDTEEIKKDVKKATAEAEKKFDKASQVAKEEYEELSGKAKSAYNSLSKEAQEDWQKLSKESKKRWAEAKNSDAGRQLQKPEVWGSLLGVTNLAVLGSVLYFSYANWQKPRWDRRVVSATVIGLGTWFGLQGWLIPQSEAVQQKRNH